MKRFFLSLAITAIGTLSAFAQNTLTKVYKFEKITSIEASSIYDVTVTKGNSGAVTIEYDDVYKDRLIVRYYNGKLELALEPTKLKRNYKNIVGIKVQLQMPTIEEIDMSGASSMEVSGEFQTDELDIELSGASSVKGLEINGNSLSMDCSGASSLYIKGDFKHVETDLSGAASVKWTGNSNYLEGEFSGAVSSTFKGDYKNADLECSGATDTQFIGTTDYLNGRFSGACSFKGKEFAAKDAHVELSGASKAHVRCTGELKVKVSGASKITHYGSPEITNLNKDDKIIKGD